MDYIRRVGETMTSYHGVLGSKRSRLGPQEIRRLDDVYLIFCVIALSLDPLFCYILVFNVQKKCLRLDTTLGTPVVVLRFLVDFFYIIHMVFQFRDAIVSLSSQASERVKEMRAIARRYLFFYFPADVLVILPLPQVVGAFWYLFSIERNVSCWSEACQNHTGVHCSLFCDDTFGARSFPNDSCSTKIPSSTPFNFGIYADALESGVVNDSADFVQKISYCFWWGLQNLSSLGQGLKTSTYVWEVYYAVFVSLSGLVLLSSLIGNMQTYLQLKTARLADMRSKEQEREYWMAFYALPPHLKTRIREYQREQWQEYTGVSMENFFLSLPRELRCDTKRHLCLPLLMRVPVFEKMDERLLNAMCDRLNPVQYTMANYIVREGDPVDEMLFIMRGRLLTMTTNGGRTGFFNSEYLKAGDFCGEELLTWALDAHTSANLPISTRTVQALIEVEAFALKWDDLKFVASQFGRLHSKQLQHTFRFYSQQWRTWAASFIQAAWRRHMKKKLEESLREEENRLQDALAKAGVSSPSLGATIYASRFAANTLRSGTRKARVPERLPAMLLQKPAEPDFTAEEQ